MRLINDALTLSASDLMTFMGCKHASRLDLDHLHGIAPTPAEMTEEMSLLSAEGDAHEERYLEELKTEGGVFEVDRDFSDLSGAVAATRDAMRDGHRIIYQAAFLNGSWGGYSDFLERVETPSSLGAFSYEVMDTKLKRKADPKHVLQLVLYSDMLAAIQGHAPSNAHLQLGDGERVSLRLKDYNAYARLAQRRLEAFVTDPTPTSPEPVSACTLCRWREHCADLWDKADSLSLVAGITKNQRAKLEAAGVSTMAALAAQSDRIPKLAEPTRERLQVQARLQTARRTGGSPSFELRPEEVGKGLRRLPRPDPGDLFYDIEGDPYFEGGLEYLHGVWFEDSGEPVFKDFWAHDRAEEGESLRALMSFFAEHLANHPHTHIYHYAPYEITALRRLVSVHGTGEALLDQMLREDRFVDLYSVISGGLIASEPAYSLKNLEVFYMEARDGDVVTAGGSVVAYEKWRENKDPKILKEIRDYNEVDCISTAKLRDWLIAEVRPEAMPWKETNDFSSEKVIEEDETAKALRERLAASGLADRIQALLFDLHSFHKREAKPGWWGIFDRLSHESEELVDDIECLGLLKAAGDPEPIKRSLQRLYSFPDQDTKLRPKGMSPCLKPAEKPVNVELTELDLQNNTALVKFGPSAGKPPEYIDLLPARPIATKAIEESISQLVGKMIAGEDTSAIKEFLERSNPEFLDGSRDPIIDPRADIVTEVVRAILDLNESVLPIQGPPGTGKTYVSSHAILALATAGRRVAVASNSHPAIDNLLLAALERAEDANVELSIAKKGGEDIEEGKGASITWTNLNDDSCLFDHQIVGGTAWLFARDDFEAQFDTLIVDEAGQVSTANLAAMARCARNVVLVGDPMQLPQPLQGSHPGESGLSALEYLLPDARTVPADQGIFLPTSRRMHPDVCKFISNHVYEGRLTSDPGTASQMIEDRHPGAFLVPTPHSGNAQTAPEEIAAIQAELKTLLGKTFTDRDGNKRPISYDDILIVAPYNAQVNALKTTLPAAARVGTVDKFQGQESPICMVSMTTSSADEMPRDLEFLFSLNRLNVAVSRAQVLSLVFASPTLLEVPCRTVEQMKLVNTLCAIEIRT